MVKKLLLQRERVRVGELLGLVQFQSADDDLVQHILIVGRENGLGGFLRPVVVDAVEKNEGTVGVFVHLRGIIVHRGSYCLRRCAMIVVVQKITYFPTGVTFLFNVRRPGLFACMWELL